MAGQVDKSRPLADRMRPGEIGDLMGQEHILGEGKPLRRMIEEGNIPSMIFWGPPGSGKTTVANIIAQKTGSRFHKFSAVLTSIKEVKTLMQEAEKYREAGGPPVIVFIDEIHRFNKAQQDAFLPFVESGAIILIGATTENPSFEVIGPLLSRCRVFTFNPLGLEQIISILKNALDNKDSGLGERKIKIDDDTLELIAVLSDGDARRALNILDISVSLHGEEVETVITQEIVNEVVQTKSLYYDKAGEEHFNIISALHKSMRNSDVDASLYWLARMLEGGEDPLYIARRIVRFASEDVGMADPGALNIALNARDAVHFIGMPEGSLALAEAVVYLALAPRSNALYTAYKSIQQDIRKYPNEPVPLNIRNAPTRLMKDLGYGDGYKYAHDFEDGVADMSCLPEKLQKRKYYLPTERGKEKIFKEKMQNVEILKKKQRKG
ncbi:MAG: replication-associated recombination protein A [Acidobacteria bacterium]|nr:replication-associated recombination protein A [Acidobacteriota bacterium]